MAKVWKVGEAGAPGAGLDDESARRAVLQATDLEGNRRKHLALALRAARDSSPGPPGLRGRTDDRRSSPEAGPKVWRHVRAPAGAIAGGVVHGMRPRRLDDLVESTS